LTAPIQRYFAGRPLRGGVWGGVKADRLLTKRGAIRFQTGVNSKLIREPGCRELVIAPRDGNVMRHYWVDGYRTLLEKQMRYLRLEGHDRADRGEITGWRAVARTPFKQFHVSFVRERGYRDGLRGFSLSVLWALYRTGAELALLRELQRRHG
jgi:hypothetical protein